VIDALLSLFTAAGEENLLRNVPERWAQGVAEFEKVGVAAPGQRPDDLLHERADRRGTVLTATVAASEVVGHRTEPPDLELVGVDKRYGRGEAEVRALADIDLVLERDEVVAVVGPSGCGKTTLLRILAGLTAPSGGRVRVAGRDVWEDDRPDEDTLRELAIVLQEANLLPWLSVLDNVALPLRLRGVGRRERRSRAAELCELTGIAGFEGNRPAELSVGMRQRAAIARALIADPRILLLDEPFGALDAITRDAMNLELQRFWQDRRCASVLVTHSITEAVFLADRVVCLTARPARLAGVIVVPFDRPRPIELQHTPSFQDVVLTVRRLLAETW
jgi:NitT/TauT family transport system ATP-binding protein